MTISIFAMPVAGLSRDPALGDGAGLAAVAGIGGFGPAALFALLGPTLNQPQSISYEGNFGTTTVAVDVDAPGAPSRGSGS